MSDPEELNRSELEEIEAALQRAGAFEQELHAEARDRGPEPDEEELQAALRRSLEKGGAEPGRRRLGPWIGLLAAAAVLCFALVHYFPSSPPAPVPLGSGLELLTPGDEGEGRDYSLFTWTFDDEYGYFELQVFDGDGEPLMKDPVKVYEESWTPAQELQDSWPENIVWQLTVVDLSGDPVDSDRKSASRD